MSENQLREILINKINASSWWHVPPQDNDAYRRRGKFLASTWKQAFFYGKPNDAPESVKIQNPLYGCSEKEILEILFPGQANRLLASVQNVDSENWYKNRVSLDAKIYKRAKEMGYDAVVLLPASGKRALKRNRKPNSIELNLLNV